MGGFFGFGVRLERSRGRGAGARFGIGRARLDLEAGRGDSRGVDNLMGLCIVRRGAQVVAKLHRRNLATNKLRKVKLAHWLALTDVTPLSQAQVKDNRVRIG